VCLVSYDDWPVLVEVTDQCFTGMPVSADGCGCRFVKPIHLLVARLIAAFIEP